MPSLQNFLPDTHPYLHSPIPGRIFGRLCEVGSECACPLFLCLHRFMASLPEHIEERIRRIVETADLILLEIVRRGQTNSTVIEIIVDSEHGANLDTLADLSREIGQLLDGEEDAVKGRYRLEVSTPGLDRPLQHDWQYRKNLGRLVNVTYHDEEKGKTTSLFRLLDADTEGLRLEKAAKGKSGKSAKKGLPSEPIVLPFTVVDRVVVEPEL